MSNSNQKRPITKAEKKDMTRRQIQEADSSRIIVIPADEEVDFYEDTSEKNVGLYARVSTDSDKQTSSYEMQQKYYSRLIENHAGWKLIGIYADEGISGTSLKRRDSFNRMIEDCKQGKIDLIVTKTVSRFSRNILDCISCVRELAALNPPVGVYFETEGIYTLTPGSEMALSFLATLAQEESRNKSAVMTSSLKMRFSDGHFLTPPLLGYDYDFDEERGRNYLLVNEDEANTVKLIFYMYLSGLSTAIIAERLSSLNRQTKLGNEKWTSNSVVGILKNERYYGAVHSWKTYTPNFLDHKSITNHGKRPRYKDEEHHEPIISRDDSLAVQKMLFNAKYGGNTYLPKLKVSTEGMLRGFVSLNPNWGAFTADDYRNASASITEG
jgi:DNA invertase Pin-like site-specific DNA recombinase